MAALPTVRGSGKAKIAVPTVEKKCDMECGKTNMDADEEDQGRAMRWAYADGTGGNCWYCERIWMAELAHLHTSRASYKEELRGNKYTLDQHRMKRNCFIDRRKKGKMYMAYKRTGGVRKVSLKESTPHKQELIMPEDQFYPLEAYTRQFGDPKKNKKRGHRVSVINNIRGVVIPGSSTDAPWKLVRKVTGSLKKEEVHDTGNSTDGEVDADIIENKFSELAAEREESYQASAVGMMASIFAQAFESSDSSLSGATQKRATKASVFHNISKGPDCERENDEGAGRKRRVGFEDDDDFVINSKGAKTTGTPKKAPTTAGGGPPVGGGTKGARGTPGAASSGGGAGGAGGSQGSGGGGGGEAKDNEESSFQKPGPGRPEQSILEVGERQWSSFSTATEGSLYFGERSQVQLRAILRYTVTCSQKMLSNQRKQPEYEMIRKKLQIIESAIKLHRSWTCKRSVQQGITEFLASWDTLMVFCDATPKVKLTCAFLWDLLLQVRASAVEKDALVDDLKRDKLEARFPDLPNDARDEMQRKFLQQAMVNILLGSPAVAEARASLSALVDKVFQHSEQFTTIMMEDLGEFGKMLSPRTCTFDKAAVESLSHVLSKYKDIKSGDRSFLALFREYPTQGVKIVSSAEKASDEQNMCLHQLDDIKAAIQWLRKVSEQGLELSCDIEQACKFLFNSSTAFSGLDAERHAALHDEHLGLDLSLENSRAPVVNIVGNVFLLRCLSACIEVPNANASEVDLLTKSAKFLCDCPSVQFATKLHSAIVFGARWLKFVSDSGLMKVIKGKDTDKELTTNTLEFLASLGNFHELEGHNMQEQSQQAKEDEQTKEDRGIVHDSVQTYRTHRTVLKDYYQKNVAVVLDKTTSKKMEEALGHIKDMYSSMEAALGIVDPGAASCADKQAKHKEAMGNLVNSELEAHIDVVKSLSFGQVAGVQAQLLDRRLTLVVHIAKMPEVLQMAKESVAILGGFVTMKSALQAWVDAHREDFDRLNAGWWADARISEKVLRFASMREKVVQDMWAAHCSSVAEAVLVNAPPKSLLENPKLMQDKALTAALDTAVVGTQLGAKVGDVSVACTVLKQAEAKGFRMEKQIALNRARHHGKRSIGVDYVTKMLTLDLPEDGTQLATHARKIVNALKQKGIGIGMIELPAYIHKVLDGMLKSQTTQQAESAD